MYDRNLNQEIENEALERLKLTKTYSYGIKFLDDALEGFSNSEVIIIASKTGRGKSQLCNIIAEHNARADRKVLYLALEAEDKEIGRRIKFRNLCKRYFLENNDRYPISYNKWRLGRAEEYFRNYNQQVEDDFKDWGDNLFIKYKNSTFTKNDIETIFMSYGDFDLIILDHIHYVDITEDNENRGLKAIITVTRDMNLQYKVPIILVSHLRKSDRKNSGLIPDEEDIMGSSDIAKIATTIIMMNPSYECVDGQEHLLNTYFRVAKARTGSQALPYIAQLVFNSKFQEYNDKYQLGAYEYFNKKFEIAKVLPNWYSYKNEFRGEFYGKN